MTYRVVDFSLSKQKMDAFDFGVTTTRLPGDTAPDGLLLGSRFGAKPLKPPGFRPSLGYVTGGGCVAAAGGCLPAQNWALRRWTCRPSAVLTAAILR
jgi:hypothetical protein